MIAIVSSLTTSVLVNHFSRTNGAQRSTTFIDAASTAPQLLLVRIFDICIGQAVYVHRQVCLEMITSSTARLVKLIVV